MFQSLEKALSPLNGRAERTHPMGGMEYQVVLLLLGVYCLLRGRHVGVAAPVAARVAGASAAG